MRHKESDPKLELLVRTALKSLFDNDAQVVLSERLPGVGNSQIFVRALGIEFRIIQSGGGISVLVEPLHAVNSWRSVESILTAIDDQHALPPKPVYGSLADLGRILESQLHPLNDALSRERFASTIEAAKQSTLQGMIALKPRVAVKPQANHSIGVTIVRIIAKIIEFLTPGSKDSHAKFLPIGSDPELERQVTQEFDHFFTKVDAQISSNSRMGMMDFATVTFDTGNLRVRASRDRGSIGVSVAPIHSARSSHDLGLVLLALDKDEQNSQSMPSSELHGAGKLLQEIFIKLNEAFSETEYPATEKRISIIGERRRQSWIEDFNKSSKAYQATMP